MRICKLEIKGFKTFKDRTLIRFSKEGISCIVGPNGCGKSNIMDALLWVMGEMSSKHLRGSVMEDLIFAGAGKEPPAGFAEVSLTLSATGDGGGESGFLPPYQKHLEVTILRRLDRGGDSEYFINSQPCRLKDVQEFFMDTGAGHHGFSFIKQGAIENFISSKPEQKRFLIESAAGVSRFQSRKKEAERKLKLTNINLNRLEDLLSQQKRRLKKLAKQAESAEQFRAIRASIREKDLNLARWDWSDLQRQKQVLESKLKTEQEVKTRFIDNKTRWKNKWNLLKKQEEGLSFRLQELFTEKEALRDQFLVLEKKRASLKAVIELSYKNLSARDSSSEEDSYQSLLKSLEACNKEITEQELYKQRFQNQKAEIENKDNKRREEISKSDSERRMWIERITELSHQLALSKEKRGALKDRTNHLRDNKRDWTHLSEQKQKHKIEKQNQRRLISEERDEIQKVKLNLRQQIVHAQEAVKLLRQRKETENLNLRKIQEERACLYSEWNSLKKIQLDYYEKQSADFLNSLGSEKESFIDTLSHVRIKPAYLESAVSAYLSTRLKSCFYKLDDKEDLFFLLKKGEENNKEQFKSVRLILKGFHLSSIDEEKREREQIAKESDFCFFLKDTVEGDTDLISSLFFNTAVVQNKITAFRLKKKYPAWCFITVQGEVLTWEGDYIVPSSCDKEKINILTHRRRMKELSLQCESSQKKLDSLESNFKDIAEKLVQQERALLSLIKKETDLQTQEAELNKAFELSDQSQKDLELEIEDIQQKELESHKSLEDLKNQVQIMDQQMEDQLDQKAEWKKNLENIERIYHHSQSEHKNFVQTKAKANEQIHLCEKSLSALMEKKAFLNESLRKREKEREQMLIFSDEETAFVKEKESQLKEQEKKQEVFLKKQQAIDNLLNELNQNQSQTIEKAGQMQKQIADAQDKMANQDSLIGEIHLEKESVLLRKRNLEENMKSKYHFEEGELRALDKVTFADFDKRKAEQELDSLNKKLISLGEVNLLALKEYEEMVKENEFYQKQYKDLTLSSDKLLKAVKKIDAYCLKKFETTFTQVNSCFSKVWPSLFGGGKAQMFLTDEKDGGKGLDILVQPLGKNIQNMDLLSGGEKAMTALAVIFSIFLIQPSPFCVLDEVDAPLDDLNIVRFNSLLMEMSKVSQVIAITHNKYTMKQADFLYGVTMEEEGVSKLISLNMPAKKKKQLEPVRELT